MKFKSEFFNAVKLFLLLFLLFWSFTWNLPPDFDLPFEEPCSSCKEPEIKERSQAILFKHVQSNSQGSYDKTKYESRKLDTSVRSSGSLIPSFKEWRETEMAKHEKSFAKDRYLNQNRKLIRRKLNYASSKCGAKILASNPEARHRMAVLSEKSDEYFLNPCRVKTWFVIELCDAVEATQVELANYELYSSSPKEFSVFWSDVYPTYQWHYLGNFVAKDERTMQTFDVSRKNLGKFIKVTVHSHHGKEHYCPLSTIRVLGFSMEEKLEDIEDEENNEDSGYKDEAKVNFMKTIPSKTEASLKEITAKDANISRRNLHSYIKDFCDKYFMHCSNAPNVNVDHLCVKKPTCRFLHIVLKKSNVNCLELYSPRYPELLPKLFNSISITKDKTASSNTLRIEQDMYKDSFGDYLNEKDIIKDYEQKKSLRIQKDCKVYTTAKLKEKCKAIRNKIRDYCTGVNIQKFAKENARLNSVKPNYLSDGIETTFNFICDKDETITGREIKLTMNEKLPQEQRENDEIESAGLINKESVIFKLSTKLKISEIEVDLINKYLQQLSQSYRHQMEDMKNRINNTFQAMNDASENAAVNNAKQEKTIDALKGKIEALKHKVDFLMKEKNDLTKRVIELHGFFLILEIIIISTVFNTFLNILKKQGFR